MVVEHAYSLMTLITISTTQLKCTSNVNHLSLQVHKKMEFSTRVETIAHHKKSTETIWSSAQQYITVKL